MKWIYFIIYAKNVQNLIHDSIWQEVMNEDVGVIEGMQKGRSSPVYNGGNFSPVMDTPTLMFHKWVATNLTKYL